MSNTIGQCYAVGGSVEGNFSGTVEFSWTSNVDSSSFTNLNVLGCDIYG